MHDVFLNKQVDRVLAVGILLAVLAAGYVFVKYVYLEQLAGFDRELELRKKKNAKIDSILADEKELRIKINRQKNVIQRNRIFLTSKNPATAISELQTDVKKLITTRSKGKILAIKPFPVLDHGDYSEASLEIRVKGISHKGLQNVLYMIENKSPVLLIKELDIKSVQRQFTSMVKSEGKPEKLGVSIVVSGFFRESPGEVF